MLWCFISSTVSVLPKCVAPTVFPELPNSSFVPKHFEILLRHGARSPIVQFLPQGHRGVWQCDSEDALTGRIEAVPLAYPRRIRRILDDRTAEFPPNCQVGDLTTEGMQQHERLGNAFRDYIVNKVKLIPENLDPNYITARATWYERTYRSCISFLKGLYPPNSMNEIIDINVGTQTWDVVHPTKDMCPDLDDLRNRWMASEKFKEAQQKTLSVVEPLYEFTNTSDKSPTGVEKICDWAITYHCNEQVPSPGLITDELITTCQEYQTYFFYKLNFFDEEKGALGAAPILREMFRLLDDSLSGKSEARLNVISAHDSVVSFVLSAIGFGNDEKLPPPYASWVTMETYMRDGEPYVRFVYNNRVIPLDGEETLIPLHTLRMRLMPKMQQCMDLP